MSLLLPLTMMVCGDRCCDDCRVCRARRRRCDDPMSDGDDDVTTTTTTMRRSPWNANAIDSWSDGGVAASARSSNGYRSTTTGDGDETTTTIDAKLIRNFCNYFIFEKQ